MAFGFPAYHVEEYVTDDPGVDLLDAAAEALLDLSGPILEETGRLIRSATDVSLWSWGEKITIELVADNTLSITSKCVFPTQCFDWGQNQSNVKKFLAKLRKYA